VRQSEATYKVVKNSVVKLALEGTELEALTPFLVGPKALAYTNGDAVALAKVLRDFIKQHPALSFQRAYLEGQILEGVEAEKIAELPSREELLTKLVYLLQSPIRRLAVALNTPTQKLASVLGQVAEKGEQGDGAAAEVAAEVTSEESTEDTAEAAVEETVEVTSEETAEDASEAAGEEAVEESVETTSEEAAETTSETTTEGIAEEPGDDTNKEPNES
jgi:large subunit ribosomal protein L10